MRFQRRFFAEVSWLLRKSCLLGKPLDTSMETVACEWNCSTSWLSGTMSFRRPGNEGDVTGVDVMTFGGDVVVMEDDVVCMDAVVTMTSSHSISSSSSDVIRLNAASPGT